MICYQSILFQYFINVSYVRVVTSYINNNCQTPDLGQGLEFDFTFANNKKNNDKNNDNKNNNPHLNFPGRDGTRSLKFGTQTKGRGKKKN